MTLLRLRESKMYEYKMSYIHTHTYTSYRIISVLIRHIITSTSSKGYESVQLLLGSLIRIQLEVTGVLNSHSVMQWN